MGATRDQLESQLSDLNKAYNTEIITIPVNIDLTQPLQDYTEFPGRKKQFFIADDTYDVYQIRGVHNKVQTSADGASASIWKATSTTDPENVTLNLITDVAFSGDDRKDLGFNLKGIAVNTVTNCTVTTEATTLRLVAGDRLVCGVQGTVSSVSVTLVTTLKRVRTT